jgi:hypothetical protein
LTALVLVNVLLENPGSSFLTEIVLTLVLLEHLKAITLTCVKVASQDVLPAKVLLSVTHVTWATL